ncbi:MAG: hypothetical protein ABFD69_16075 [Candidatus Sumerlaeia bacterium]
MIHGVDRKFVKKTTHGLREIFPGVKKTIKIFPVGGGKIGRAGVAGGWWERFSGIPNQDATDSLSVHSIMITITITSTSTKIGGIGTEENRRLARGLLNRPFRQAGIRRSLNRPTKIQRSPCGELRPVQNTRAARPETTTKEMEDHVSLGQYQHREYQRATAVADLNEPAQYDAGAPVFRLAHQSRR